MLDTKQMDALVASKFTSLFLQKAITDSRAIVLNGIRSEIESLTELATPQVCSDRCNFFKLKGSTPEDFKERVLKLNDKDFILVGIRFLGLDVTQPFVSVLPSFVPLNDLNMARIADLIRKEFAVFNPQSFQMTLPKETPINLPNMMIDRYTMVGLIDDLIENKVNNGSEDVILTSPVNMDFYEEYIEEYQIFHSRSPDLSREVKAESFEDLKESLSNGLLFKISICGKFAGLIAGSDRDYYGLKGVSILEEFLFDSYRGKGHGVHIQKAFTTEMKDRYAILWGTISDKNQPSLKTALKNGRQISEVSYFISI